MARRRMLRLLLPVLVIIMAEGSDATADTEIRYVAVGDSYSIGEGATPEQSWP